MSGDESRARASIGTENPGAGRLQRLFSVGFSRVGSERRACCCPLRFKAMGSPCELPALRRTARTPRTARARAGRARRGSSEVLALPRRQPRHAHQPAGGRGRRRRGGRRDGARCSTTPRPRTRESEGRFDVTSGILRRAWDFKPGRAARARRGRGAAAAGRLAQACAGARPRLALPLRGMEIDFGGYVKEYAADRAAALLPRSSAARTASSTSAAISPSSARIRTASPGDRRPRPARPQRRARARSALRRGRRRDERRLRALHDGRRRALRAHPRPADGLAGARARVGHRVRGRCLVAGTAHDDRDAAGLEGRAGVARRRAHPARRRRPRRRAARGTRESAARLEAGAPAGATRQPISGGRRAPRVAPSLHGSAASDRRSSIERGARPALYFRSGAPPPSPVGRGASVERRTGLARALRSAPQARGSPQAAARPR